MSEPSATKDLAWVVGIFIVIGLIWLFTGGPDRPESRSGLFLNPPAPLGSGSSYGPGGESGGGSGTTFISRRDYSNNVSADETALDPNRSTWYGQVEIGLGNASYEYRAGSEYLTLRAGYRLKSPLNVTGWILENGKGNRYFYSGSGRVVRGLSERAIIPQATRLIYDEGKILPYGPVLLEPGGEVIITSGRAPNLDYTRGLTGFLENKCTDYFNEYAGGARFSPDLNNNCPRSEETPGYDQLDDDCRRIVRQRINSCQVPDFGEDRDGNETLNNSPLEIRGYCQKFIETHFNYPACVGDFAASADFFSKDWRVYLGRTWEMWSDERETITLYDQFGKIVDQASYGQ